MLDQKQSMHVTPSQAAPATALEFDADLIGRLSTAGPRYSSYPTEDRFTAAFGYRDFLKAVAGLRTRGRDKPLSLYLHIPSGKAAVYLGYLKREIEMQGRLFAGMNQVEQLYLGGGTSTCLSDEQMEALMLHVRRCFQLAPDAVGDYEIEVNPRTVTRERVHSLRRQGFNRISVAVQDDDPESQAGAIVVAAREANYRSVSIDLIYGLPRQTMTTMARTLANVIKAAPDRVAVHDYALLPHLTRPQRRSNQDEPPDAEPRLAMFGLCFETLVRAGYVYIGMDHFALPGDDLAVAQNQGRLHRNFQGYSTHADLDLVACGVSAISAVAGTYSQNVKTLAPYYDLIDRNELPISRGIGLNLDDVLRRTIIQMLMCQFELSIPVLEQAYQIVFADYFAPELKRLADLEHAGLVTLERDWVSVSPRGRLLICNVCMVFDAYLRAPASEARYARTI